MVGSRYGRVLLVVLMGFSLFGWNLVWYEVWFDGEFFGYQIMIVVLWFFFFVEYELFDVDDLIFLLYVGFQWDCFGVDFI